MTTSKTESSEAPSPWYADGLSFQCTQCGDCCSGEPGYVFVEQDEIERMAEVLSMPLEEFEAVYLRRVGKQRSLKEYSDGDCILLDRKTRGCKVYAGRPTQCRTWPFWDSNLASHETWQETCDVCPGASRGRVYGLSEIETMRKAKSV